jgi:small conductance mechanosensitive channel
MPLFLLDLTRDDVGEWFNEHGTPVIGAIVLAFAASAVVRAVVPRALRPALDRQMEGRPREEIDRRAETLSGVILRTAEVIFIALAIFTILPEFGFDIRAVLAGVSITAVAVGLGAQSLVRDALNGVFILTENQYGRGDVVTVYSAGVPALTGTVEDITLRRTLLRDVDGIVYSVPNGSVIVAANLTRDFPRVRVSVPVHATSDLAAVRRIADETGAALAQEPEFAGRITEAPRYVGVDSIDANGVAVQVNGAVTPGSQRDVAVALRARLLEALQRAGVRTPWG